jgi:hypothetical protein
MFVDFILLWLASIWMLKFAMKGYLSVEMSAFLLMGVLIVVVFSRIMGSNIFRERSRIPKFFVSLAFFCLSVADGDVQLALIVAAWTTALPICLFGLYIMFRSAFGRM